VTIYATNGEFIDMVISDRNAFIIEKSASEAWSLVILAL